MKKSDNAASAAIAWQQARALQGSDRSAAKLWFARAAKLAPEDPRIAFDLATLSLGSGNQDELLSAAAQLETIAAQYDFYPAWLALIAARHLLKDHKAAAAALGWMLGRHCLRDETGFATHATLIAAASGLAGWCGMTPDGTLHVAVPKDVKWRCRIDGIAFDPAPMPGGYLLPQGRMLDVTVRGKALCGSPLDLGQLRRVEGVVATSPQGLTGWASRPAAPETAPEVMLTDAKGNTSSVVFGKVMAADNHAAFLIRHRFKLTAKELRILSPPFRLQGPDGADILGSPINPAAETATRPVPALKLGKKPAALPRRRKLAVVMPVYRDLAVTTNCLHSLFAAVPAGTKVVVVDDATPEPGLADWLDELSAGGRIHLIRHAHNRGFPAAANAGIRAAAGRDVLLLNSDTLVPPGAIEMLQDAVYARPEIGSATPFSNAATILNYPLAAGANPVPDLAQTIKLNQQAAIANGMGAEPIPTGVGFCMILRHDCLRATGLFRDDLFAQGYGEENDWCLRARHLGYRHVAATGAYVAHHGGVSFRAAGQALNARNAGLLNRLHPGYDSMIAAFIKADPLAAARKRFDLQRFTAGRKTSGAVLLISHQHGGGVARQVANDMTAIKAAGQRPILLFPAAPADLLRTPFPWDAQLTDDKTSDYPNLRFKLPAEWTALLRLLKAERIERVIFHHSLGHHPSVRDFVGALRVPQDIVVHDYASFCPRINLLTRPDRKSPLRYCGEPQVEGCVACVKRAGEATFERLGVKQLIKRSALEFASAARVTVPSEDAAKRLSRHFPGITPQVTPWEDDTLPLSLRPPRVGGRRKIVVIGGIGPSKGFDVLAECARDARQRQLRLDFVVAGASAKDAVLFDAGIFVTGAYAEGDATKLLRELDADLAFLPSIWPETWCFALSEAWAAGLYAVAFDLGAQAVRLHKTGRGAVLPLGMPAGRINDWLLSWRPKV